MSFPIFNPRLELVRLLIQAIRGDDTTTLAAMLAELDWLADRAETYLPFLQNINNSGLGLLYSDGNAGEPPAGAKYPPAFYQLLTAWQQLYQTNTANQAAADDEALIYLPRLAAIDTKIEALSAMIEGALYNQIDSTPLYAYASALLGRVEADLPEIRSKLFAMETALLDIQACVCAEEPPPALNYEFPSGECNEFSRRYRFSGMVDVLGVPGSGNPVVYAFTNISASGAPTPDFIRSNPSSLGVNWIASEITADRQACYVTSAAALTHGLVFRLERKLATDLNADINFFTAATTEMTGIDPALSQTFTMLGGQDEPTTEREFYTPSLLDPLGRDLLITGNLSVWLCVGGLG